MPTRTTPPSPGTPCWVDLFSSDVERAKAFYGELFGWTCEEQGIEFGNYVLFRSDGQQVAGMMRNSPEYGWPDVWSVYFATDDVRGSVDRAIDAGGELMSEPMEVMDMGSMAMVKDPAGAVFGLWQPKQHIGYTKYNDPDSIVWTEHHSKDFPASTPFYEKVFGWDLEAAGDTDDFRYSVVRIDGKQMAGLMDSASFLPPQAPSFWTIYVGADDVDSVVSKLESLGGTVLRPAEDTPYGRMADVTDPTGANFKLLSPPEAQG